MQIDHIAIWVKDLENEKEFYLKYFDCTVGEIYINSVKRFRSYFISFKDGSRIELMNRPDIEGEASNDDRPGLSHFAINVGKREIVDHLTGILGKDGHKVTGSPRITGDGYYESIVLDPEGNRIEIFSV